MKVVVVDYGLGNIYSVVAALEAVGVSPLVDTDGSRIAGSGVALVPGVAAFGAGMGNLKESGQAEALDRHHKRGDKLIGLCLGAQMFMQGSDESPTVSGLGYVEGTVVSLDRSRCVVPNQGWLRVRARADDDSGLLGAEKSGYFVYFSHSYRVAAGPTVIDVATARSGTEEILAVYHAENVIGVQFHPERSGHVGLGFLARLLAP